MIPQKKKKYDSVEDIFEVRNKEKLRKKFEKIFSSEQKNFKSRGFFNFRQLLMFES
jgi:hypothetical protein